MWPAVKFGLVGVINTATDLALFAILMGTTNVGVAFANLVSYGTGVVVSFLINSAWTFSSHTLGRRRTQFVRFVAVSSFAAVASSIMVERLCLLVPPLWAKALSLPFMFALNFLLVRHFVFRRSDAAT